ncbi:MAG: hypothetical protein GTN80_04525 [Nitrososphaeria archaeon]|nr:hypothetical protein [Nitrososphaeria archaeon]NIT03959.1 hypothetical protein [Candidatus Saccharibacteria bacterium]
MAKRRAVPIDKLDVEMASDGDLEAQLRAGGVKRTPRDVITVEEAQEVAREEDAFDHLALARGAGALD